MDFRVAKQKRGEMTKVKSIDIDQDQSVACAYQHRFLSGHEKKNCNTAITQDRKKYLKASKTHPSFLELKHPSELFTCNKLSPFGSGVSRPGLHIVHIVNILQIVNVHNNHQLRKIWTKVIVIIVC